MYEGVGAETPATDAAVAATSGQIVTYNGAPAITYFFSSSGGHTENIEDAWPGAAADPWLRGVADPYDGAGGDPYHHWTVNMSLTAASKHLHGLLKGKLVGIKVTEHGASPRIMTANVVGTGGSTTVTGSQLQSAFGLLSTWASFTTVSSAAGHLPADATQGPGQTSNLAMIAQVKRLHGLSGSVVPTLRGTIFPAGKGAVAAVQELSGKHWHTSFLVRLARGGGYEVRVPGAGTYRVSYRGVNGPSVFVP
jgi:stage II sporulation protein D